jgi:sortase A
VRRVIGAIGRSFVTVGVLILLFVAYQLWGTGLYTSREQDRLRREFTSLLHQHTSPATTSTTATTLASPTVTPTTLPPILAPIFAKDGAAVAQIRIPKIGVDDIVVQGISRDALRRGPGHYPDSPFPGQVGSAAIAGHRTTYGAPFGDLDQLEKGDRIFVRTVQGNFTYVVFDPRHIVAPNDVSVLEPDPTRPAILTLTTCNPKFSASQRLVVRAALKEGTTPLPAPKGLKHLKVTEAGLSGEKGSRLPTLISGLIAALIGGLWWLVFHRHPRWVTWVLGAVPFAVALFFFYSFLERVLPANY